jgi:hypothetical protein
MARGTRELPALTVFKRPTLATRTSTTAHARQCLMITCRSARSGPFAPEITGRAVEDAPEEVAAELVEFFA